MALDTYTPARTQQKTQDKTPNSDQFGIAKEEYSGIVETEIARKSLLSQWVDIKSVRGAHSVSAYSVGSSTLQKVVPGVTPDGSASSVDKIAVVVDTPILARKVLPMIDEFQTSFDVRSALALANGKAISKWLDEVFFIQGIKSALRTTSPYGSTGFLGGSSATVTDPTDPAALQAAVMALFAEMAAKDVSPSEDGVILVFGPQAYYTLLQSEQLINANYITATGNEVQNGMILKAWGVPVIMSNNMPGGQNITGHYLSNASNGNAYDGDFTNVVGVALSPSSLLAGQTIPLTSAVTWDAQLLGWLVDSYLAVGVTPNRSEYAGVIVTAP